MATSHPYSRPSPVRVKCVMNYKKTKSLNFQIVNGVICPGTKEITHLSALSSGGNVYVSQSSSSAPFEEGVTYYVKNYTVSSRYRPERLFIGVNTTIYRTSPLSMTAEEERLAREALIPPSTEVSGLDQDLFSRGGYLTLQGIVENLQVPRMTKVADTEVPILDLSIRCGSKLLDVSLWRDQALIKMQLNDLMSVTHLKANAKALKLNSTSFTTVEIMEQGPVVEEVTVVGLSEANGEVSILTEDFAEFTAPSALLEKTIEELVSDLPLRLEVVHRRRSIEKITNIKNDEMIE